MKGKNEIQNQKVPEKFKIEDKKLLMNAFTHPTYVFENKELNLESNQRLEFLGDAVLGLVVAEYLFKTFPAEPEGVLTKMRAKIVCETTLAKIARELKLGSYMKLGKGEDMTGGRERDSNLADTFEALLGAIYIDSGISGVKEFLQINLFNLISEDYLVCDDFKTTIQELAYKKYGDIVVYRLLSEFGPDHQKQFEVGIYLKNKLLATAVGHSKKEAEQKAAEKALALEIFSKHRR